MKKSISKFKLRNAGIFLGMCLLVGCSHKEQTIAPTITTDIPTIEFEKETFIDRLASELKKDTVSPIYAEDTWDHIILYERDVRYYTDGSIGYSEWNLLGEYFVRDADLLENKLEYRVERKGIINLNDVVAYLSNNQQAQVCYVGDPKLSVDDLKMFTVNSRDYINGEYSDYKNDGTIYLTDDEFEENDLINFNFLQYVPDNLISSNSNKSLNLQK